MASESCMSWLNSSDTSRPSALQTHEFSPASGPLHVLLPPPKEDSKTEKGRVWCFSLLAPSPALAGRSPLQQDPPSSAGLPSTPLAWFSWRSYPQVVNPTDELLISHHSLPESPRVIPDCPCLACLTHLHLSNGHAKPSWSSLHAPSPSELHQGGTVSISPIIILLAPGTQ